MLPPPPAAPPVCSSQATRLGANALFGSVWAKGKHRALVLRGLIVMKTESQLNWTGHTVSAGPPTSLIQIYSVLNTGAEKHSDRPQYNQRGTQF